MERKRLIGWVVVACLAGMIASCHGPGSAAAPPDTPEAPAPRMSPAAREAIAQRIGVYDSRSVAVAFAGSPTHEAQLAAIQADLASARALGDPERIAAAEERIREAQRQLHGQGFGTAPVDDILALFPEQLERLKKEHHLTALVSQWDEQTLARFPDAKRADVTPALIEIPGPNDRQRARALDIRNHTPLTPAQVEEMNRQEMR